MIGDPTVVVLEPVIVIFPSPSIDLQVNEFRICIPFLKVGDGRALFLSFPLRHSQTYDFLLLVQPKLMLLQLKLTSR